jgi:hypothetical protein
MRRILCFAAILAFAASAWAQSASTGTQSATANTQGATVFAYFKEPGTQGIYFALSRDGYTFTPLNDGQPWIKPESPGEIMRDVFITRNPSGDGFRAVWTWGWKGSTLGTASSADLMTWSHQTEVPIMKDFPTVRNVWAPETYWDADAKQWLLIWSSALSDNNDGNRIWAARTKDFVTFSKPAVFFDPGFVVIDATMFHHNFGGKQDWVFVVKDQSVDPLRYQVRWTSGPSVEGPWAPLSGPITESWSEGPSVIQVGSHWIVYYDHYRAPRARYEGVETGDWLHWTSVNDKMHFPEFAKHGSFLHVTGAEAEKLLGRHDSPVTSPSATVP